VGGDSHLLGRGVTVSVGIVYDEDPYRFLFQVEDSSSLMSTYLVRTRRRAQRIEIV
jgi:hypothetical protein